MGNSEGTPRVGRSTRPPRLSRRRIVRLGGVILGSAVAAGCDVLSTQPDSRADDAPMPAKNKGEEAPMLAEQVRAGKLPPLAERLPETPMIVEPAERIGVYGGAWRAIMLGPNDTAWLDRSVGYEMLLRWRPETVAHNLGDIMPNLAESYDVNDAGTEYTFRLRKGTRWSDGEPFTADDVIFAVDDVFLNPDLYPSPPAGLRAGDGVASVEKVDDVTVRFVFPEPSGLFPHFMASKNSGLLRIAGFPRHYLERFHFRYATDLDALVEAEGVPDWVELFFSKCDPWNNPELPRLHAWVPTNSLNDGSGGSFERNPYYWKVDPEGSQLPYLDRVVFEFQDLEVALLSAANGEVDMYDRMITTMQNKPVLAKTRQEGDYHFVDLQPGNMNAAIISLNLTHQNPIKREIFRNKEFRVALSHALNRHEIIDTVYLGQAEPWQVAPLPGSDLLDEELAKQYTEYDVDRANEILDRAGFVERDSTGIRLGPDGAPISFTLEISTSDYGFGWAGVAELVKKYWAEVGVHVDIRSIAQPLWAERYEGNLHDATIYHGDAGGLDPHLMPTRYMPYVPQTLYAVAWAKWNASGGAEGEEPPERTKQQMRLYDRLKATPDEAERTELMRQILRITREEFYSIGICYPTNRYAIVRNDFHNVPSGYIEASNYPNPAPTSPEQYFTAKS